MTSPSQSASTSFGFLRLLRLRDRLAVINTIEAATNSPETVRVWGPTADAQLIRDGLHNYVPWGPPHNGWGQQMHLQAEGRHKRGRKVCARLALIVCKAGTR